MKTIIIDDSTIDAIKMVEFLKTQSFARIVAENEPNEATKRAILEVEEGKVTYCSSVEDMMAKLK